MAADPTVPLTAEEAERIDNADPVFNRYALGARIQALQSAAAPGLGGYSPSPGALIAVTFDLFTAAGLSETVDIGDPAGGKTYIVNDVFVNLKTLFDAPTSTNAFAEIGYNGGSADEFMGSTDVDSALGYLAGSDGLSNGEIIAAGTQMTCTITLVGDNVQDMTAGELEVWVDLVVLP